MTAKQRKGAASKARRKTGSAKGKAKATPKPVIPIDKLVATSPSAKAVLPSNPPKIGPVQEKDTMAKVTAMKKIPSPPPTFEDAESILLAHELGRVSS